MKSEQFKFNMFSQIVFTKSVLLIFLISLFLLSCSDEKDSEEEQRQSNVQSYCSD